MPDFLSNNDTLKVVCAAPLIYVAMIVVGRWLKRRGGVRLGLGYHLFAGSLGFYLPLSYLPVVNFAVFKALTAVTALLGTFFLLALLRRVLWEYYFEERQRTKIPRFVHEVVALLILVIVVMLVLTFIYEIKIPGLLAGSGILAVMLGLAMQDTLGNIITGLGLHFEKPFKPGDWLILDNRHAEVIEINWRSTRLRTNDDIHLDIPNNQIARSTIVNLSYPTRVHAMRLTVGVDYQAPPNLVKDLLVQAAGDVVGVLREPPPKVFLNSFGESAVIYEVKFWLDDQARFNDIMDAIRTNIWYGLDRARIKIPYPIRTLQFEPARATNTPADLGAARAVLDRQPVFQCLDEAQRDNLLARARLLRFGRGEKIIRQGQDGSSMFILLNGEVEVVVSGRQGPARVATLRGGDCFGEMSLLTGEQRSATVTAGTDCEVVEIDKLNLGETLKDKPALLEALSDLLARRRLENEGVLAGPKPGETSMRRSYAENFLTRLKTFFEL